MKNLRPVIGALLAAGWQAIAVKPPVNMPRPKVQAVPAVEGVYALQTGSGNRNSEEQLHFLIVGSSTQANQRRFLMHATTNQLLQCYSVLVGSVAKGQGMTRDQPGSQMYRLELKSHPAI